MNKKILVFFIIILVALFFIWAPWITKEYAKQKAITEFNKKWRVLMMVAVYPQMRPVLEGCLGYM